MRIPDDAPARIKLVVDVVAGVTPMSPRPTPHDPPYFGWVRWRMGYRWRVVRAADVAGRRWSLVEPRVRVYEVHEAYEEVGIDCVSDDDDGDGDGDDAGQAEPLTPADAVDFLVASVKRRMPVGRKTTCGQVPDGPRDPELFHAGVEDAHGRRFRLVTRKGEGGSLWEGVVVRRRRHGVFGGGGGCGGGGGGGGGGGRGGGGCSGRGGGGGGAAG